MKSATRESRTSARRAKAAKMAAALGLLIALATTGSARAEIATPEQKRACTPDVYRLCAGEIPNVRAITACLRRQKANLSDACRAVFDQ
jgi:DNA-binding transcriptional LysR family regulator